MSLLPWLPTHPDLSGALRAAKALASPAERLGAAITLARHDRDAIATNRIAGLLAGGEANEGLAPVRLALLGSHTLDHLVPAMRVAGLNHGLALEVHTGHYGLYREDILNSGSSLASFRPHAVLLCLDLASLVPQLAMAAEEAEVAAAIDGALARLRQLWAMVRDRLGARVVQQTFIAQQPGLAGSNEWLLPASPATICRKLNERLHQAARDGDILLLDLDLVQSRTGGERLYDPARWHQAKQLVNPLLAPLYADHVARILAALQGKARRCLVLDLDNTLWGGAIGDCGVEGIVLGQGNAAGEAFQAMQHYAAMLHQRGIVLAVCSKNDHDVAKSAFDRHPDMRIGYDDFACFIANWSDKATNLRAISKALNLGLDAFVFVDDNPAERAIIRRELPEVAVPELPDDIALYPERIAAAGYFEAAALTREDFLRSKDYHAIRQRGEALEAVTDMDGFLSSLDMRLTGGPITPLDLPRAAQLINKSNQFNLTTRRRSEAELSEINAQPNVIALAFRLRDRFGDSGLISVVIARPDASLPDDELLIDTWLMSCRVLGRGVEQAALDVLCAMASERGIRALVGHYIPSGRNGMVKDHYAGLGFEPVIEGDDAGRYVWRLCLARQPASSHHLELEIHA